jgi:D-alanine-D-alanine ligase
MRVAVIYNEPQPDRYHDMGEAKAEQGVMDEVRAVHEALMELGYVALLVPLCPPLSNVRTTIESLDSDVIFNLFEGFDGSPDTEPKVAKMLEETGIAFTGCPASTLELALDKARTKALLEKTGIKTPGYQILAPENLSTFHLSFPCIIKPLSEDASHGLSEDSVVWNLPALEKQIRKICKLFGGQALVEEFLEGPI